MKQKVGHGVDGEATSQKGDYTPKFEGHETRQWSNNEGSECNLREGEQGGDQEGEHKGNAMFKTCVEVQPPNPTFLLNV